MADRKERDMKGRFLGVTTAAVLLVALVGGTAAQAQQIVTWEGNGLDSVRTCVKGVDAHPYLHWVLTPGETPVEGTMAELFINGHDVGTMTPVGESGALQLTIFVSGKITMEQLMNADIHAEITAGSVGENAVLTISDGCLCEHA
jgi:hypothetical protein